MRFGFSHQQIEFRDAVRRVLDKECTATEVRSAFASPSARTPRWATLADMGVVGLTVPEEHGGLGLTILDLISLLEEAGRVALPEPLLETTALAVPLLASLSGGSKQRERARAGEWLDAIAAGEITVAVAPVNPLDVGNRTPIAGAVGAELFIMHASAPGNAPEIHAVPADQTAITPIASLDPTRRLATVEWEPTRATLIRSKEEAHVALVDLADRAAVATAAELLGLADRMISLAAEYAKERHQFGKPIGSFQAVKHLLAGAQVKLEFARPTVYAAAWSLDESEPTVSRSASLAKAFASDAATEAARVSLQVHGAIGYTWECDLHLYMKRAWALAEAWGSAADHRARILASLVEGG
jgi:alkylation response protein AidB-like acyl-CoA dehydrogenase